MGLAATGELMETENDNGTRFVEFPKMPRLNREMVITEKIDGTNAQVCIVETMDPFAEHNLSCIAREPIPESFGLWRLMFAGSRTRWITPTNDNYGFAKWVAANTTELFKLGPGRHFGEWWGKGIQRGYGLDEKRFSLFNVGRWFDVRSTNAHIWNSTNFGPAPECCHVVPVLYRGPFSQSTIDYYVANLREMGSKAALHFMKPEGVVVYHTAAGHCFKVTLENDEAPKSQVKDAA